MNLKTFVERVTVITQLYRNEEELAARRACAGLAPDVKGTALLDNPDALSVWIDLNHLLHETGTIDLVEVEAEIAALVASADAAG